MTGPARSQPDVVFDPQMWQERTNRALEARLPQDAADTSRLQSAMRYAVLGNGKRVRPLLVYVTGTALGTAAAKLDGPAVAVEFIHSYSLVHDDLPAMDNDDLRRGRPTCHIEYDEATAILAGDALQMLAVQVLADDQTMLASDSRRVAMISLLARASGIDGMAGGQAIDLEAAGKPADKHFLERMHLMKTGELIRASVMLGALSADGLSATDQACLNDYGAFLGLAFQITDDIFDYLGAEQETGKAGGSDLEGGKITLPLLTALRNAPEPDRRRMEEVIRSREFRNGQWPEVVRFVTDNGGVAQSEERSTALAEHAESELRHIPDKAAREALHDAVRYAVTRRR